MENSKMNDSHLTDAARAYLAHLYTMSSRRSWQILIRLARANGDPELAVAAKKSLDKLG